MKSRLIGIICLLGAAAAVIWAAGLPEPPGEPRLPKRRVTRAEVRLFGDPEVERQLRSQLGEIPLDEDALKEVRSLTLESVAAFGKEIATLEDLPRLLPNVQVLTLDFHDRPLTGADWAALEGLPHLTALRWTDGTHQIDGTDWAHLGRLRLTGLGISADGFAAPVLPAGLESLALRVYSPEKGTLPESLLLTSPDGPLPGGITEYYRYIRDDLAVELVRTDAWVEEAPWSEKDFWGGWETRLLLSRPTEDGWTAAQVFAVEGRANAGDGVLFQDVDFDGRTDLLVMLGHFGAQGLVRYTAYLQQPDGGFAPCPSFFDIPNPAVDAERRVICGSWRNSASSHSWAVYAYQNGAFRQVRRLTEELVWDLEASGGTDETWRYVVEADGAREVWRTDEHTEEETWDRFFDDSSSDWGIAADRWRALPNDGPMIDFSIYTTDPMRSITQ